MGKKAEEPKRGRKIICHNCGYSWIYKGGADTFASCPKCTYKVHIEKNSGGIWYKIDIPEPFFKLLEYLADTKNLTLQQFLMFLDNEFSNEKLEKELGKSIEDIAERMREDKQSFLDDFLDDNIDLNTREKRIEFLEEKREDLISVLPKEGLKLEEELDKKEVEE